MSGSMYLAASGAILQQLRLEILANNVANINTPGYKEDIPIFRLQDNLEESNFDKNIQVNNRRQKIIPYAPPFGSRTDFSSGPVQSTGNPLDFSLNGDGFFTIQSENGIFYTRQGHFKINEEGILVTQNGDPVLGQGGEISIEGSVVTVGTDGSIEVDGEVVDQFKIVRFEDLQNLQKIGNTLFAPAKKSGPEIELDAENTTISQGFVELSNVNPIRSMTDMIEAMRASEAYQKVIQSVDESMSKVINEVGTV